MNNVLIVEPDLTKGMSYVVAMIKAGFHAEHATSGAKALVAFESTKMDVVVINLLLRDNQALKLLKMIRSISRGRPVPIVAFTPENLEDLHVSAQIEGATECLTLGRDASGDILRAVKRLLAPPDAPPAAVSPVAKPPSMFPAPAASPAAKEATLPAPASPAVPAAPSVSAAKSTLPEPAPAAAEQKAASFQTLKELSQRLFGERNPNVQRAILAELHQAARAFASDRVTQVNHLETSLLEAWAAMLGELSENPSFIGSSNLRTLLQAVNSLEAVLKNAAALSTPGKRDYRVLAVDDDPTIYTVVKRTLASAGLASDHAKDVQEALTLSKQQAYDLFILDVNMPGQSGFALCEKLRATPSYKETPVIFVTGSDNLESRIRSAGSGGDDFIGKPFLPRELAVKTLIHLLRRRTESRAG